MAESRPRQFALDGVRGLAAVAVLLFHVGLYLDLGWLVGHGALAVDVFFVMSGFVVDRAYGERLRAGWAPSEFLRARLARLYPLHLLGTLLGAGCHLLMFGSKIDPAALAWVGLMLVCGVLLVPILRDDDRAVFHLNAPSWSLMVEAGLNLAFAAVGGRLGSRSLLAVTGVGAIILLLAALDGRALLTGGQTATLPVDLARGAFGFGAGLLLSRCASAVRLSPIPTPAVLAALALVLAVPRGPHDAWLDPVAILVVSPLLVAAALAARPGPRLGAACARLGALSYPLYAVHMPLLYLANSFSPKDPARFGLRCAMIAAAGLAGILLAGALARWVEPVLSGAVRARLRGEAGSAQPARSGAGA